MGIRVNKVVGWGTRGFVEPADFDERREQLWELSPQEFVAWMSRQEERIAEYFPSQGNNDVAYWLRYMRSAFRRRDDGVKLTSPAQCVRFDPEFGLKDAIVAFPIHMGKCHRRDDLIDWCEENGRSRWKALKKPIYPFEKGDIPVSVIGLYLFLGLEDLIPQLEEVLYVYWA